MKTTTSDVLRWIALPIVVVAAFMLTAVVVKFINLADRISLQKLAQEKVFWEWVLGITEYAVDYFIAAIAGIFAGYGIAPSHKKVAALVSASILALIYIVFLILYIIAPSQSIPSICSCIGVITGCTVGYIMIKRVG